MFISQKFSKTLGKGSAVRGFGLKSLSVTMLASNATTALNAAGYHSHLSYPRFPCGEWLKFAHQLVINFLNRKPLLFLISFFQRLSYLAPKFPLLLLVWAFVGSHIFGNSANHTVWIEESGAVKATGSNEYGQLGLEVLWELIIPSLLNLEWFKSLLQILRFT